MGVFILLGQFWYGFFASHIAKYMYMYFIKLGLLKNPTAREDKSKLKVPS